MWSWPLRLLLLLCLFAPLPVSADQPIPYLNARVTDLTGTLTPSDRQLLENKLRDFEARKGSQVALLIINTTQPEPIESYSMRVVQSWKLGRKGVDDGVLFIIAKADRRMRIEVGYGVEGALTDIATKRIIEDIVGPHFKQGDFFHGIDAGVDAIIKVLQGEELPVPTRNRPENYGGIILVATFVLIQLGQFLASIIGKTYGAGVVGLLVFGLGLIAFSPLIAFLMAVFMSIISYLATFWKYTGGSGGGYYGGSGYSSGSSGGFSGGGGSFGGGGSSGSW